MMKIAIIGLLILMVMFLFTFLRAKIIVEKIMIISSLNNLVLVLICFLSLYTNRESYIDIAYIYVLLGFLTNLGIYNLVKIKPQNSL